jgi:hypothetical protein
VVNWLHLIHRLEYPNKFLENAAQDVTAAINYLRANADKYNVDKDRICLIAFSAGGPMLSLAMRGELGDKEYKRENVFYRDLNVACPKFGIQPRSPKS